jgi:pyridoxamine 5'-phosphate oxidase
MNKAEILKFMQDFPVCYLATMEENAPRVRVVLIYKVAEGEIIIQTNVKKDLNKQMIQNPSVELLFHDGKRDMTQVRVRGKVEPLNDTEMLDQVLKDRPYLKAAASQGNGPSLFRMKNPSACVWTNRTNNQPKTFIEI